MVGGLRAAIFLRAARLPSVVREFAVPFRVLRHGLRGLRFCLASRGPSSSRPRIHPTARGRPLVAEPTSPPVVRDLLGDRRFQAEWGSSLTSCPTMSARLEKSFGLWARRPPEPISRTRTRAGFLLQRISASMIAETTATPATPCQARIAACSAVIPPIALVVRPEVPARLPERPELQRPLDGVRNLV